MSQQTEAAKLEALTNYYSSINRAGRALGCEPEPDDAPEEGAGAKA